MKDDNKPRGDHDNNRLYRSPKAWAQLKAIGARLGHLESLLLDLERTAIVDEICVRVAFAAAIHHYVNLPQAQRRQCFVDHCRDIDRERIKQRLRKQTLPVGGREYRLVMGEQIRDDDGKRCHFEIDHVEGVVWLDPEVGWYQVDRVIEVARQQANEETREVGDA